MTDGPLPTADPACAAAPGARGAGVRWERYVLPALLALAAVMRFPNLATRGTWEADQGHDMLMLRALVQDGIVPLLGPPTSIGDVHHGAWYYYLLSPAAALTGGDSARLTCQKSCPSWSATACWSPRPLRASPTWSGPGC